MGRPIISSHGARVGQGSAAEAPLAHPREVEHVEEVHEAQDQRDDPHLGRDVFNSLYDIGRLLTDPEEQQDKTQVDEVKAHQKQVVHRVRHLLIPAEGVDQEKSAVPVERAPDPFGHHDADQEIGCVDAEAGIHSLVSLFWMLLVNGCLHARLRCGPGRRARFPGLNSHGRACCH